MLGESSYTVIPVKLKYQVGRRSYTDKQWCNPMTYLSVLFISVYCLASIVAALSCFLCSGAFQRSVLKEEGAEDMDCCLYTLTALINRKSGGTQTKSAVTVTINERL